MKLPALRTEGNHIIDAASGARVVLHGINRSGLEYSSPTGAGALANAGMEESEWEEMVLGWGANLIRIPFNQEWVLHSEDIPGSYLYALDTVIGWAACRGAYTLLDLQWLDARTERGHTADGRANFVPPLPDDQSVLVWQLLARRYRAEPAVLFDLFNEPHDPLKDDGGRLLGVRDDGTFYQLLHRRVGMREWQPWAQLLLQTIRAEAPETLVFVSGVNWAFDLRGFPLENARNVVYATHVYPAKGNRWERAFGFLAGSHPVFAAEIGGADQDLRWGEKLLGYLREREIGWSAWSWSDHPHLIHHTSPGSYLPTLFGALVRDHSVALRSARTTAVSG